MAQFVQILLKILNKSNNLQVIYMYSHHRISFLHKGAWLQIKKINISTRVLNSLYRKSITKSLKNPTKHVISTCLSRVKSQRVLRAFSGDGVVHVLLFSERVRSVADALWIVCARLKVIVCQVDHQIHLFYIRWKSDPLMSLPAWCHATRHTIADAC